MLLLLLNDPVRLSRGLWLTFFKLVAQTWMFRFICVDSSFYKIQNYSNPGTRLGRFMISRVVTQICSLEASFQFIMTKLFTLPSQTYTSEHTVVWDPGWNRNFKYRYLIICERKYSPIKRGKTSQKCIYNTGMDLYGLTSKKNPGSFVTRRFFLVKGEHWPLPFLTDNTIDRMPAISLIIHPI